MRSCPRPSCRGCVEGGWRRGPSPRGGEAGGGAGSATSAAPARACSCGGTLQLQVARGARTREPSRRSLPPPRRGCVVSLLAALDDVEQLGRVLDHSFGARGGEAFGGE